MQIPKKSKKVFSGKLFDLYQWEQKVYDGSFQTFEMIARKPSVDVIATVGDKIIVLMQEQPTKPLFPSLPGGRIEDGQSPIEAARAELLQETGYKPGSIKLMAEFFGSSKICFHESIFIANNCVKVKDQELDGGEKIKVTFKDFDSFFQLCRNERFTAPRNLITIMYEALIDSDKKDELKRKIFGNKGE